MKAYNDVDLFILADPKRHEGKFDAIMHFMHHLIIYSEPRIFNVSWGYNATNTKNLIKVATVGRLQIILIYFGSCRCNFHLDRKFFYNFHHVTRYRFYVYHRQLANGLYQDVWFPVYIPFSKELRLVTKTIKINICEDEKTKYPQKHIDNIIEASPPTLQQQCLNKLMETTFCQNAKKDMKQGRLTSTYSNYRVVSMQHPYRAGRVLWNFKTRRVNNGAVNGTMREFDLANFPNVGRPPFFLSHTNLFTALGWQLN